ncbi:hypothetical protein UlMin_007635 [Ulmus minor]
MDSIHKLLNILLPLLSFTILLLFLPPFLIYKLFTSIKKFKRVEDVTGKVVLITGASSGIGEDINFWGSVYCTQFALPNLRKSKGKIIVLSSCSTWFSPPKLSFYNASKTAQLSFFETLKAEFGSEIGITIATPGIIKSEMTTRQVRSQYGVSQVPILSAEVCAKGIVESACRGEMYSTEPSWYKVGFWFKVLCPQLMFKCLHLSFIHSSRRTSENDA